MNIASRLVQYCMIAAIGIAVANYFGQETAAKIAMLYARIVTQYKAAAR